MSLKLLQQRLIIMKNNDLDKEKAIQYLSNLFISLEELTDSDDIEDFKEMIKERSRFFKTPYEVFEYIYLDENYSSSELRVLLSRIADIKLLDLKNSDKKTITGYLIENHEHVYETPYGYVFLTYNSDVMS